MSDSLRDRCNKKKKEVRDTPTIEKVMKPFVPNILDEILDLPYSKKKTIRKSETATRLVKFFLHQCYTYQFIDYDGEDGTAPISSIVGERIMNGSAKRFLIVKNLLVDNGYIGCDNRSSAGLKAFHYYLGKKLKGEDIKWKRQSDKETFKLIEPMKKNETTMVPAKTEVDITVDYDLLDRSIDNVGKFRDWEESRTEVWKWFLEENFDHYYTETDQGRVYGKWARTPKELRGCFLIDGEATVEPDISNSHPTFLTMFYDLIEDSDEEKQRYIKVVESGKFYDCVQRVGKTEAVGDKTAIDIAKLMTMKFLGGCWKDEEVGPVKKFFTKVFPRLFTFLGTVRNLKDIKMGYKSINLALQEIEADVIVNHICEEFDAVSLHDAVICKASQAEMVQARIEELILEKTKIHGKVKIDNKREKLEKIADGDFSGKERATSEIPSDEELEELLKGA